MKDFFKRYIRGSYSEQDLQETVSFLNTEEESVVTENMKEHWDNISDITEPGMDDKFENVLHRIHNQVSINKEKPRLMVRFYKGFTKVAAVLVLPLMFVCTYFLISYYSPEEESVTTLRVPFGMTSDVVLPDGTKVVMNSGSTLKYPSTFKDKHIRRVELNGEAYFEVVKNKQKPFLVKTKVVGVEVLGTTFNVKAYEDDPDILVALFEGSVKLLELQDEEVKDLVVLKPGEIADLNKERNELRVKYIGDLSKETLWKKGEVVFNNEPFDAVMRYMSRKYNVEYEIKDKSLLEYRITATFIHESLEKFLEKLSICSSLNYEIVEEQKDANGSYTKKRIIIR